jgi:hypothetical protein
LRDAIRTSHEIATSQRSRYEALALGAREALRARADAEVVWTRLASALDSVAHAV